MHSLASQGGADDAGRPVRMAELTQTLEAQFCNQISFLIQQIT